MVDNLPPNLQQYSNHKYGSLRLKLSKIVVHSTDGTQFTPLSYQPQFLGQKYHNNPNSTSHHSIYQQKTYNILTTLWHFFLYLSDIDFLKINIVREQFPNYQYFCKVPIVTKEPSQILNNKFTHGNLLKYDERQCDLWDNAGRIIGKLVVRIDMEFDSEVHIQLSERGMVDFSQMLVIEGISRIGSMGSSQHLQSYKELHKKHQQPIKNLSKQFHIIQHKQSQLQNSNNKAQSTNFNLSQFQNNLPPRPPYHNHHTQDNNSDRQNYKDNFKKNFEEDQKILNDDIDRLIIQMQSKPYDSSRYQQETTIHNKYHQQMQITTNNNTSSSKRSTHSPHINNPIVLKQFKMPPLPLYKTHSLFVTNTYNNMPETQQNPNYNSSSRQKEYRPYQVSLSPHVQHSKSSTNFYHQNQNSGHKVVSNDIQEFKLQIHELLITCNNSSTHRPSIIEKNQTISNKYSNQLRNLSQKYQLSVYIININLQQQLVANLIGLEEETGNNDTIKFQHTSKLSNSKQNIEKLKFQLKSYQSFIRNESERTEIRQVISQGYFEMDKLLNGNKMKGFYMVPLMHQSRNDIRINSSQLQQMKNRTEGSNLLFKKVELPVYRTLRIQLQAIESLDRIVQVYINMSNIRTNQEYQKVRYKIPYTKDTIQFNRAEIQNNKYSPKSHTHFNIFPHSKKHQSLILQFWNASQKLVGISDINLRGMKSVPYHTLTAGIQPIYLYDGKQSISSLTNRSLKVGEYDLLLCYGTVKQVQQMLKGQNLQHISKSKGNQNIVEVQQDRNLGIFVKRKKDFSSAQIQVEIPMNDIRLNNIEDDQDQPVQSTLYVRPNENLQPLTEKPENHNKLDDSQNQLRAFKHYSQFRSSKIKDLQKTGIQNQLADSSKNDTNGLQNKNNLGNQDRDEVLSNKFSSDSLRFEEKQPENSPIKLRSVLDTISQLIVSNLRLLTPEQTINALKQQLKQHTLYNFIDLTLLKQILENLPLKSQSKSENNNFLKRKTVKTIIHQILLPKYFNQLSFQSTLKNNPPKQTPMINVNILYDLILCMELKSSLQTKIKDNLIPSSMIGYHVLSILYGNFNFNTIGGLQLSHDILIEEETDWSEMRNLMKHKGYKLTMLEYNAVMQYLKTISSKHPQYTNSQKSLMINLRDKIRRELLEKEFAQETEKIEQQNVIEALYGNYQSGEFQDSRQSELPNEEISLETSRNEFLVIRKDFVSEQQPIKINLCRSSSSSPKRVEKVEEIAMRETSMNNIKTFTTSPQPEKYSVQNLPSKLSTTKYNLGISGLPTCQQSASYLFDGVQPEQTYLRILINAPIESTLIFKTNCTLALQSEDIQILIEQLEGEAQLCLSQQGINTYKILARAAFCIIRGVNSVYALKSQDMEFCGVINLLLNQL